MSKVIDLKLLDRYSWMDICQKTLSTGIEERLLVEAYRKLPRDLQRDTLGLMLFRLQGPLPEASEAPTGGLYPVK